MQSAILAAIIVFAAVVGGTAYVMFSGETQSSETIKIGALIDVDASEGLWRSLVLAVEHINSNGGILGRQVKLIAEDSDAVTTFDLNTLSSALVRLIAYHNVDFIVGFEDNQLSFVCQDIVAEHKKIFFELGSTSDELTQRVLDDYEKYKYYFRLFYNATSIFQGMTDSLVHLRNITGFNKVGYIGEDLGWTKGIMDGLDYVLPEVYGFDLVYRGKFPYGSFDFSSYFAAAEAAGVEILTPLISTSDMGIAFAKEYSVRQSPMIVYGGILGGTSRQESWDWSDGKIEYMSVAGSPAAAGYPLTSKTLLFVDAYYDRWGIDSTSSFQPTAYDLLRYILPSAIERAGTIETNAVIEALEQTSIETVNAKNYVFTSSHDVMMGENPNDPNADYMLVFVFQWQNGEMVPVYPKKIMEEAGASFMFPPWSGPWDK